ncbi:serine--tRNA ligase [Myxococcota bacterium]|nr:serine--tRNA ligase [Myxococcota bacterium]MBU1897773.1 serine--tRNA ligase [Myxococcota bacterium]
MLDIREIRQSPERFRRALARRGQQTNFEEVIAIDAERRALIQRADQLRQAKSETEKGMRGADKQSAEFTEFRDKMRQVAQEIKEVAAAQKENEERLRGILLTLPNLPAEAIPDGADEHANVVLRTFGEKPQFDFEPKEHVEIGERLGLFDFERAVKISRSRFTVSMGAAAHMERALMAFMLDMHTTAHGYTEVLPPFLVNAESMEGTGQFPKFREDAFELERDGLSLIPTAEVPVTNLHRDEILELASLPVKYTAYTPCFRREAGSYGRDTRGLIRQHQFQKVELVQFTRPEDSEAAHEALTGHAEAILQALGLHYRVVDLCAGDLGFSAQRTYDLEVWLPGQGAYREISSCSNFGDFQARRAAIRYRPEGGGKPQLVHTLNGSGLAIGRTVVAILENYQQADGGVLIPEALQKYMGGMKIIS